MNTSISSTGLRGLAAAGICSALALSSNAVGAADFRSASVTVKGAAPMEPVQITLMGKVNYSDLDLATYSGAIELKKRVRDAAQMTCKKLDELYPLEDKSAPECTSRAEAAASHQVDAAIAAAERVAKARTVAKRERIAKAE